MNKFGGSGYAAFVYKTTKQFLDHIFLSLVIMVFLNILEIVPTDVFFSLLINILSSSFTKIKKDNNVKSCISKILQDFKLIRICWRVDMDIHTRPMNHEIEDISVCPKVNI